MSFNVVMNRPEVVQRRITIVF